MTSLGQAVVIGSGMGGLTAAILLQTRGYRVTLLEQHYRPGGMLHRFYRPGGRFDTGFHYCGGIDPGQPLGQCLRHLGVFDGLEFHALDPDGFDRLRFPDLEFRVPVGWRAYEQRLIEHFPHEADGIRAIVAAMQQAADRYGLYRLRETLDFGDLVESESTSVSEVVQRHITDARLRGVLSAQGVLYGVQPDKAPFGVHSVILDHFLAGAWTVRGGGDALALAMVRRLRSLGGTVHLRTEATRIEVDGRTATAVHTADGRRFEADLVISNLHPRLTLDLLPPEATRQAYRTRVGDAAVGHAHLGVYLQVRDGVPELGRSNVYRYDSFDIGGLGEDVGPGRVPFYFATAPSEHVPSRRPGDGTLLMVLSLPWRRVAPWAGSSPDARPGDYAAFKEGLVEAAVQALLSDFPSLEGRLRSIEGSTPLSTEHYTRSPQGAVYGHLHSIEQMGRYRPTPFLRVQNMALVGQGVGLPGVLGVTLSAYYAVGRFVGAAELLQELRSA